MSCASYAAMCTCYHINVTVVHCEIVGVFVAVLIFQFSISMSLIIVSVLLMVDLEVYGFIYVIGAKLNCKFIFIPQKHHFIISCLPIHYTCTLSDMFNYFFKDFTDMNSFD